MMPRFMVKRYGRLPLAVYVGRVEHGWWAWDLLFRVPLAMRLSQYLMKRRRP